MTDLETTRELARALGALDVALRSPGMDDGERLARARALLDEHDTRMQASAERLTTTVAEIQAERE